MLKVDVTSLEAEQIKYNKRRSRKILNLLKMPLAQIIMAHPQVKESEIPFRRICYYRKSIKGEPVAINTLGEDSGKVIVKGQVFDIESRETRSGKLIYSIDITDYTSSITVKTFATRNKVKR